MYTNKKDTNMNVEVTMAKLEARVDQHAKDIDKILVSLSETRDAALELTTTIQQMNQSIKDYAKTLYGNGDRKRSLVTMTDNLYEEIDKINQQLVRLKKISRNSLQLAKNAARIANTAKEANIAATTAAQAALTASENFNKLSEGNIIQFGKLKLSGHSANIAAIMIIPISILASIGGIIYIILAAMGKVSWVFTK